MNFFKITENTKKSYGGITLCAIPSFR